MITVPKRAAATSADRRPRCTAINGSTHMSRAWRDCRTCTPQTHALGCPRRRPPQEAQAPKPPRGDRQQTAKRPPRDRRETAETTTGTADNPATGPHTEDPTDLTPKAGRTLLPAFDVK